MGQLGREGDGRGTIEQT